jgi:hypothetical protein
LRIVFERGSTPDEVEIFESIRIAGSVVGDKVGGLEALEAFVPVIAGIEELTRNLQTFCSIFGIQYIIDLFRDRWSQRDIVNSKLNGGDVKFSPCAVPG